MKFKSTTAAILACLAFLPAASIAADGAALYTKHCKKCHALEAGKNGLGPSLSGIFGKQAGQSDFTKYKALKGSDIVWDDANMDAWITDPKKFIGKATTMVVKVKKADERAAIIEFLKTQ